MCGVARGWIHTMYVSESAVDIRSAGAEHDTTRGVKILPVSQLAAPGAPGSPGAPSKRSAGGLLFGGNAQAGRQEKTWAETLLPSLVWMKAYKWRDSLRSDAVAGVTVGTMLIPQVSYGLI